MYIMQQIRCLMLIGCIYHTVQTTAGQHARPLPAPSRFLTPRVKTQQTMAGHQASNWRGWWTLFHIQYSHKCVSSTSSRPVLPRACGTLNCSNTQWGKQTAIVSTANPQHKKFRNKSQLIF